MLSRSLRKAAARYVRPQAGVAPSVRNLATQTDASQATTVEELHSRTAHDILKERDAAKSGTMRHFTVNFG
jgi:NADH dehydrogenase (ubiquinone) Fe-S protein 2